MVSPCDVCKGACCESIVLPIRFDDEDSQRWLGYHGEEIPQGMRFECKCLKLKHGKCSIYESRPEVCRVFEVGSPACRDAVRHRRQYKAEQIFKLMEAGHGKA